MCAHSHIHAPHKYVIHTTHMKEKRRSGEKEEEEEEKEGEGEKLDYWAEIRQTFQSH